MPDQGEHAPDFRSVAALFRRRWRIMLPFLALPLGVLAFSLAQQKQYEAVATVIFHDFETTLASEDPDREAATNVGLFDLEAIKRGAYKRLGGSEAAAKEVEAESEGRSNLLHIAATDPSPRRAARTANAFSMAYVAYRRRAARLPFREEERVLRRELGGLSSLELQGVAGISVRNRLQRLQIAKSRIAGANVVARAEPPSSPASPKPIRNTLIGGVLALLLAGVAAIIFERLDPRLRTASEAESALDRPVLAMIRKSRALAGASAGGGPPSPYDDDFAALRSHLRFSEAGRDVRSVLITSGATGDGKTTVAWNLAWAAAASEARVLLLEADIRQPTLTSRLGLNGQQGLTEVLDGEVSLQDVVLEVAADSSEDGHRPARMISVAVAGKASTKHDDPSAWERLGAAIETAERQFDFIVVDTPPMLFVPDAIPLASRVGGVIVVGRLGSTPRGALPRLREQLDRIGAPLLGVVVNCVDKDEAYGYGYGYGYGARPA